ncbi:hypothetical protein C8R47DRAFT_1074863 [Mycena vitilis]|nr:hypothetical protein C8R47DRAFT_1074863 [Mycena vitilis]
MPDKRKGRKKPVNKKQQTADGTIEAAAASTSQSLRRATTEEDPPPPPVPSPVPSYRGSAVIDVGGGSPSMRSGVIGGMDQRLGAGPRPSIESSAMPSLTPSVQNSSQITVEELAFHRALVDGRSGPGNSDNNSTLGAERSQEILGATVLHPSIQLEKPRRSHIIPSPPASQVSVLAGSNCCSTVVEVDDVDDPDHVRRQRDRDAAARAARERQKNERLCGTMRGERGPDAAGMNIHRWEYLPQSDTGENAHGASRPPTSVGQVDSIVNAYERSDTSGDIARTGDKGKGRAKSVGTARSVHTVPDLSVSDENGNRPPKRNPQLEKEAIERDRETFQNTDEFRLRREKYVRSERRLQELRIEEDLVFAQHLADTFAQEAADLALAQEVAQEEERRRVIGGGEEEPDPLEAEARALEEAARAARAKADKSRSERQSVADERKSSVPAEEPISKAAMIASTPTVVERQTHNFANRVILQKWRTQDLMATGKTGIADQGIDWDANGKPFEVAPAPSRGSSVGTRGGKHPVKKSSKSPQKIGDLQFPDVTQKSFNAPAAESSARKDDKADRKVDKSTSRLCKGNKNTNKASPPVSPKKEAVGGNITAAVAGGGGGGESSSSSELSSDADDSTYKKESTYSRSEATDSAFDEDIEVTLLSGNGSIPHTRSRKQYGGGGDPPDDPGAGSDSDESSSDSDEASGRSKGSDKHYRKKPGEIDRQYRKRMKRNRRRKHHSHGKRSRAGEVLDSKAHLASKQIEKWRKSLHYHYIRLLKTALGKRSDYQSIFDDHRQMKIPPPVLYNGAADIVKFDEHVLSLVRWLELIGLGGKKNDHRRILTHGFYLTGVAKQWYENQVIGLYRSKWNWTYQELILGLFERFINTACVQKATELFYTAKYSAAIGAMGLYYEMMTAARRMIKRPDSLTFKSHFIAKMPEAMVDDLVDNNITAEMCTIKEVLEGANNYEWKLSMANQIKDQRKFLNGQISLGEARASGGGAANS